MSEIAQVIVAVLSAYVVGWLNGHDWMHKSTASDVSVMQKMRNMTKWLESTKRFGGEMTVPSCTATYIIGDDRYQITLVREQDATTPARNTSQIGEG